MKYPINQLSLLYFEAATWKYPFQVTIHLHVGTLRKHHLKQNVDRAPQTRLTPMYYTKSNCQLSFCSKLGILHYQLHVYTMAAPLNVNYYINYIAIPNCRACQWSTDALNNSQYQCWQEVAGNVKTSQWNRLLRERAHIPYLGSGGVTYIGFRLAVVSSQARGERNVSCKCMACGAFCLDWYCLSSPSPYVGLAASLLATGKHFF